jgi:predicted signal transduction protein with EAL and GGDEF domain
MLLKILKQLGVRVALDDFGTGYSNFTYLKHFNLDRLKLINRLSATSPQARATWQSSVRSCSWRGILALRQLRRALRTMSALEWCGELVVILLKVSC